MHKHLILLSIIGLLYSCTPTKEEISFTSDDGKVTLTVSGVKTTPLDPFNVTINTKGYGHDENQTLDIYAGKLDESTVKMDWTNNQAGMLTFYQQDETVRSLLLRISEQHVSLKESGSTDETIIEIL